MSILNSSEYPGEDKFLGKVQCLCTSVQSNGEMSHCTHSVEERNQQPGLFSLEQELLLPTSSAGSCRSCRNSLLSQVLATSDHLSTAKTLAPCLSATLPPRVLTKHAAECLTSCVLPCNPLESSQQLM